MIEWQRHTPYSFLLKLLTGASVRGREHYIASDTEPSSSPFYILLATRYIYECTNRCFQGATPHSYGMYMSASRSR